MADRIPEPELVQGRVTRSRLGGFPEWSGDPAELAKFAEDELVVVTPRAVLEHANRVLDFPEHEMVRLVAERTPVRITFSGGERMPDLPSSGVIEFAVIVHVRVELGGLVLTLDRPDGEPWSFWTGSEGGFHPRVTKICAPLRAAILEADHG